ncbi:hypothetical protein N7478_003140 [Penicillium angulare]|uniref:uncharacterized protein n=1 Tax=Penicillium angulare TaxID=116970 RepID=UPI002541804C|nr:uncharacterized protein N7478_003140 [Penicillium angulare]KAJ5287454.1 hypothetical protein N7478_003140 [Penicillium angulare]
MPPPVEDFSDAESGDVPFAKEELKEEVEKEVKAKVENGDEDEDSDDGDDEDVYIVEKIAEHNFSEEGVLLLRVKWKGYEKAADMTWEPEDGLMDGAKDVVEQYYKKIGGRPDKPSSKAAPKAGRKRKSLGETKSTAPPASQNESKKRRKSAPRTPASETPALTEDNSDEDTENWLPKGNNWDREVNCVDTIVRGEDNKTLFALLLWTNGKKTKVSVETCYDKCPKKMLRFYEQHLVFKDNES